MNDYENQIHTETEDCMTRIQAQYELRIKKAVILQLLEILRHAVGNRVSYTAFRMEDMLKFLIDALKDYDIGESENDQT
jgi:hypothetical protein